MNTTHSADGLPPVKKFLCFIALFTGVIAINWTLDNDIWFLLNGGKYVLTHGIPHIEPFTIHPELNFVMQQWLTGLIFWCIYDYGGAAGLLLLVLLIFIAIIVIIYRLCMLLSSRNFRVSVMLSAGIGVFIAPLMQTRPQIVSGLLLIIAIYCLELYVNKKKARYLLPLPLLSLFLVNLHAALWPMIFLLLLPYIADSFLFPWGRLKGSGYAVLPLLLAGIFMFLSGFINPYGWEGMTYLSRSYGIPSINMFVSEMAPLTVHTLIGKIGFCALILPLYCYARYREVPIKVRHILLTAGTGYLALSAVRGILLFGLCGLFPLAHIFARWTPLCHQQQESTLSVKRLRLILIFLLGSVFIFFVISNYPALAEKYTALTSDNLFLIGGIYIGIPLALILKYRLRRKKQFAPPDTSSKLKYGLLFLLAMVLPVFIVVATESNNSNKDVSPPVKLAIDALLAENSSEDIILWTGYNDGGYAEFRGIASYLDTRAEVFLFNNNRKKDILDEYIALESGGLHYKEFISRYNFTHFLADKNSLLYTYLYADENYRLLYEDSYCRLFEKR